MEKTVPSGSALDRHVAATALTSGVESKIVRIC